MADQIPLKIYPSGSSPESIREFVNGDIVPVKHGGTGKATALTAEDVGAAPAGHTHPGMSCFDIDVNGNLMPSETVMVDEVWETDLSGDLMPRGVV